MKTIPLTKGQVALVDEADYLELSRYRWRALRRGTRRRASYYAVRTGRDRETVYMHRQILGLEPGDGLLGDHRNRDTLDNRGDNLRAVTPLENSMNRTVPFWHASRFKGVVWRKAERKWQAQLHTSGRTVYLGCFESEVEAARAYNAKAVEVWGDSAALNEVPMRIFAVEEIEPYQRKRSSGGGR